MKNLYLIISFLISIYCYSQYDYGNTSEALKLCIALQENSFSVISKSNDNPESLTSISKANDELDKILETVGASKRFIVQPCTNVNNAIAIQYKGIRYIFYNPEFMLSVSKGNSWSSVFILAHEVGHHINGHTLDVILYTSGTVDRVSLAENRKQELEADEFAGFVLAKLGASLEQTIYSIDKYSSDKDDINSTHPAKNKRLAAIKMGYKNAFSKNQIKISKVKIAEDFFYSGVKKHKNNDLIGAISDYTITIGLDASFLYAYSNRALAYKHTEQYSLSLKDYNKAIELDPQDFVSYDGRGSLYLYETKQYDLALKDYNKAIKIDPLKYYTYYNRARVKMNMSQSSEDSFMYEAMADLTKSIDINPTFGLSYLDRGMCKYRSLSWNVACNDFIKAIELGEELPDYIKSQLDDVGCN